METVNTPVPTLRATLAAPVTLAMYWIATDSIAQVIYVLNVQSITFVFSRRQ